MRIKDIVTLRNEKTDNNSGFYIGLENIESWNARFLPIESYTEGTNSVFHAGEILFGKLRPYLAKGYLPSCDGICSTEFFVLRANKGYLNSYLLYLFLSQNIIDYLKNQVAGVKMPRTNWNDFANIEVNIPSLSEQERIVAYLDEKTAAIDRKIELLEKQLDAYTRLKSSIINHAVTRGLNHNVPLRNSDSSWLGQIPEHWKEKRFCDLFTFHKGLSITKADLVDDGVAVISYGQIHAKDNPKTSLPKHLMRYVAQDYLETDSQSLLAKYDFVFADTSEDVEGSGNFAFNDYDGQIFAGYHTLTATGAKLKCPKYFAYLIQTVDWKRQIQSKVAGIKVFSIGRRILRTTTLLIPPLSEQQAIADYLDAECAKIDARKENISKRIDAYRRLKRALINETVTGQRAINAN